MLFYGSVAILKYACSYFNIAACVSLLLDYLIIAEQATLAPALPEG